MAPPAKPKEIKPKEGGDAPAKEGGGGMDLKFIITLVVVVVSSLVGSAATMYFLAPMVIVPAVVAKMPKPAEEGAAKEDAKKPAESMNLELEEFTVNLKRDPQSGGSQFVRTKMALSVKVPEEAGCAKPAEGKKEGGEGKEGAAPAGPDPCQVAFNQKMGRFVPSMRDIINAALMKRTADSLDSVEGQESLKDEIKEQINALIGEEHYEIGRVNFEDFIIQH